MLPGSGRYPIHVFRTCGLAILAPTIGTGAPPADLPQLVSQLEDTRHRGPRSRREGLAELSILAGSWRLSDRLGQPTKVSGSQQSQARNGGGSTKKQLTITLRIRKCESKFVTSC